MDPRALIILVLEAAFALWLLYKEGLLHSRFTVAVCVFFTVLAFGFRGLSLDYKTLDYIDFLSRWVDFFRQNGGFKAISENVGNYNIPYLYFLALFSYSDISDLYLIKELSIFFDVILAWSAMKLVGLYWESPVRRIAAFFTVLLLPTVVLNGSLWGQCDSTYAAMAVLGLYLALDDRPVLSMVAFAVSFGFKLQAVFIMPVIAVLWMMGKYKWKHFFVFPLTYVLLVLPAVFLGRPFIETLTLYFSQTGSIGSGLNYNSPSVFGLINTPADEAGAARLAVITAFGYMLVLLAVALLCRKKLDKRCALLLAVLFAVGIPFLLPHMHDRYFFAADVLTVVVAFTVPELSLIALLTQFSSLLGYHAYLKMRYLLLMYWGSCALIAVVLVTAAELALHLAEKPAPEPVIDPLPSPAELSGDDGPVV